MGAAVGSQKPPFQKRWKVRMILHNCQLHCKSTGIFLIQSCSFEGLPHSSIFISPSHLLQFCGSPSKKSTLRSSLPAFSGVNNRRHGTRLAELKGGCLVNQVVDGGRHEGGGKGGVLVLTLPRDLLPRNCSPLRLLFGPRELWSGIIGV